MNGLVRQEKGKMQPAAVGAGAAAGASLKRPREASAVADAEKRWFKGDLDLLECPICSEPFAPPVYQCENGHTACASCCKKFTTGCPTCSQPTGSIRCLAVEKMIDSIEIDCQYAHRGCKSMVKLSQREEHEKHLCEHRPIQCPVPGHNEHEEPKSQMTTHLLTRHYPMLIRVGEDASSASFDVDCLFVEYVVLEFKEKWLLLHCWTGNALAARMYCISFGRSKNVPDTRSREFEVAYKLRVEPVNLKADTRTVVYSMEAVALDYSSIRNWNFDYLFVPIKRANQGLLEVTVTLA